MRGLWRITREGFAARAGSESIFTDLRSTFVPPADIEGKIHNGGVADALSIHFIHIVKRKYPLLVTFDRALICLEIIFHLFFFYAEENDGGELETWNRVDGWEKQSKLAAQFK